MFESSSIDNCSSQTTQNTIEKFNYTWTIDHFSYCWADLGQTINSSIFTSRINNQKWRLELLPEGKGETSKDFISLFLYLISCDKSYVKAKVKLAILNNDHDIFYSLNMEAHKFIPGRSDGFKQFIKRDILLDGKDNFLPNDTLTISCEISVLVDELSATDLLNNTEVAGSLTKDLGALFEMKTFADVTISVNGKEFRAHKCILAARSPVFAAMFEHNMVESNQNRVVITDADYKIVLEMVKFMYTGQISNLDSMAYCMLAAADMYALDGLKGMCEEILRNSMTAHNVADLLILADLHNAHQLLVKSVWYIHTFPKQVMKSTGWKNMEKSHPYLVKAMLTMTDRLKIYIVPSSSTCENSQSELSCINDIEEVLSIGWPNYNSQKNS